MTAFEQEPDIMEARLIANFKPQIPEDQIDGLQCLLQSYHARYELNLTEKDEIIEAQRNEIRNLKQDKEALLRKLRTEKNVITNQEISLGNFYASEEHVRNAKFYFFLGSLPFLGRKYQEVSQQFFHEVAKLRTERKRKHH